MSARHREKSSSLPHSHTCAPLIWLEKYQKEEENLCQQFVIVFGMFFREIRRMQPCWALFAIDENDDMCVRVWVNWIDDGKFCLISQRISVSTLGISSKLDVCEKYSRVLCVCCFEEKRITRWILTIISIHHLHCFVADVDHLRLFYTSLSMYLV